MSMLLMEENGGLQELMILDVKFLSLWEKQMLKIQIGINNNL